jgi:DNA-binding transcriptional MerR regulator
LNKAPDAFRTISEVAEELDLPQHVLRFWESRFPHIKPLKRGGGRRYYRPEDIDLLRGIQQLLYADGYTIKGVQRILREQGVRTVQAVGQGQEVPNLAAMAQDDGNGCGNDAGIDVLTPPRSYQPVEADDGDVDAPAAARAGPAPKNSPIAEAGRAVASPAASLDARERAQVIGAPVAGSPFASVAGVPVAVAPAAARSATTGTVAATSSPPRMAATDLDRLKHALAQLEACRRLLDKAIEGER